jgi:hypothetical protein
MDQRKLAFVIGGAQKSGTTSLDAICRQHPQLQMASVKETHFFDNEERDWNSPDYSALHAYFTACDDRLRGESTPITMYWRPAVGRLHKYNPDIRMVLILRDPVTRAYSNWRHEYFHGRENMSFSEAIRRGRSRVRCQSTTEGLHRFCSYVERGFYGDQLNYISKYIPKPHLHCEIYEELFQDRPAALERIARFLGIDPFPIGMPVLHLNAAHDIPYPCALSCEDIDYLSELLHYQKAKVEEFLQRRIPSWGVA